MVSRSKRKDSIDNLFLLRTLIDHSKYMGEQLWLAFFDIEKCSDSLEDCINALWVIVLRMTPFHWYCIYKEGSQDWIYILFNVIDFYVKHSSPSFKNLSRYVEIKFSLQVACSHKWLIQYFRWEVFLLLANCIVSCMKASLLTTDCHWLNVILLMFSSLSGRLSVSNTWEI